MHMIGSLASRYLSLLCSRRTFLWPCQGTVIRGICLSQYKTAGPVLLDFQWHTFHLPTWTSTCLFSCTTQYCKVYGKTKSRKVTKPVILSYKFGLTDDCVYRACISLGCLWVIKCNHQLFACHCRDINVNMVMSNVKCNQSGQERLDSAHQYKANEIQLAFNQKCSDTIYSINNKKN